MQTNHRAKKLAVNALVTALYVVIYLFLAPFSWGPIQFRLSEGLNHLNAFHKDYKWGVIAGVFLSNFYGYTQGLGWYDLVFGTLHTAVSFFICDLVFRKVTGIKSRLAVTVLVFSVMIWIVALELYWALDLPFWPTYLSTAVSEFIVLTLTAFIMYFLDTRLHFKARME